MHSYSALRHSSPGQHSALCFPVLAATRPGPRFGSGAHDPAESDPEAAIVIATTRNLKGKYQIWTNQPQTWENLRDRFCDYERWPFANSKDDAPAFCGAKLIGDRRENKNVAAIYLFVSDHDDGQTMADSQAIARQHGLETIIVPSFNFNADTVEIRHDDYVKWAQANGKAVEVTEELGREYLEQTGKLLPPFARAATYDRAGKKQTQRGFVYVFSTPPREKHRCIRPMRQPIVVADYVTGDTIHKQVIDAYQHAMREALASLGGTFDPACAELARAYYEPVQRSQVDDELPPPIYVEGAGFDFEPFLRVALERVKAGTQKSVKPQRPTASTRQPASDVDLYVEGFNLKAWTAQYARTFLIEPLLEARELVVGLREQGGVYVECFQEDSHTPAPTRTFAVNGGPEQGFVLHCSGGTNGCNELDRLQRLKGYIQGGKITVDDLQDPQYGGGPISARVYHEARHSKERQDLRVVDSGGRGIDVGVFHASMIAKPRLFDFNRVNSLCATQISTDVTAEQLAGFIKSGRVTVPHLVECLVDPYQSSDDDSAPYERAIRDVAKRMRLDNLSRRQVDEELEVVKTRFRVRQKAIDDDFKRARRDEERSRSAVPGLLSPEDSALLEPMRDYIRDFAIVNTGGKGVVLGLQQPDLSKAIMPRDDFEFLHRNEWFEIPGDDGSITTIYPAKEFLTKPPRGCQVYRGGLVFKPSGTVGPDEYNLYGGMLIDPDPSGSYEMLKDLIRDVWVQGDEIAFDWVREYLLHIIAHPGAKVGTSLAIRGGYGDGKSIGTEKLMSTILGDMLLRVANQRLVLGDFNEAIIGKLLIVLEEAAFAGDKAAFDRMKEQVTGDKVVINPKFKAPIIVDNHARMIVVSNHQHFMHLKPGDRRYTVLESSPAWNGSTKFEQLLDEWSKGGAARFVYDALNHSFRRFDDRQRLVINSNLKTRAAVRQMAHSRSGLEKCIVGLLLRGEFISVKDRYAGTGREPLWSLDEGLEITSHDLQDDVTAWLRDYDARAVQHEATLHTIIATLEKYVGKTEGERPKAKDGGKWVQGPTVRTLPCRQKALQHALKEGLITDEEYGAAVPRAEGKVVDEPNDLLRALFPYILLRLGDGTYIALNRLYKPVGFVPRAGDWVDYGSSTLRFRVKGLTPEIAAKVSVRGSPDTSWITLYLDDCRPQDSIKHQREVLRRVKLFFDLVEIENVGSVQAEHIH